MLGLFPLHGFNFLIAFFIPLCNALIYISLPWGFYFSFYTTCFYLPKKILHTKEKKEVKKKIEGTSFPTLVDIYKKWKISFLNAPSISSRRWSTIYVTTDFQLFRFASTQERFHLWDLFFFSFSRYLNWNLCQTALVFPEQAGI